jgi:hypothetical protein
LDVNGKVSLDQSEIRDRLVQFYNSLFAEQHTWRPRLVLPSA